MFSYLFDLITLISIVHLYPMALEKTEGTHLLYILTFNIQIAYYSNDKQEEDVAIPNGGDYLP